MNRFQAIKSVGEECLSDETLTKLMNKEEILCYDGFEPSGRMHIAQGIMKATNVNKLTSAGCKFIFLVADWFAMMNGKMGGDLAKIKIVGQYMIEVWKACGMNLEQVEFVWSSEIMNQEYWLLVMDIAKRFSKSRITRCCEIMGRKDTDDLTAAQIFYPCMQCADIFFLKADICQLGMDQRKVNMLALEYCEKTGREKPVILSHHMLMGLKGEKMGKSDPNNAIFMDDSEEEVERKISKAFCEPGNIVKNPVLEYVCYIILPMKAFVLGKTYTDYKEVEQDFQKGLMDPKELKRQVAKEINLLLQPVRSHFEKNEEARKLMEQVRSFKITK